MGHVPEQTVAPGWRRRVFWRALEAGRTHSPKPECTGQGTVRLRQRERNHAEVRGPSGATGCAGVFLAERTGVAGALDTTKVSALAASVISALQVAPRAVLHVGPPQVKAIFTGRDAGNASGPGGGSRAAGPRRRTCLCPGWRYTYPCVCTPPVAPRRRWSVGLTSPRSKQPAETMGENDDQE